MTIEHKVYGQNRESIGDLDALNLVLAAIDRLNHHEGTTPHSQLWLEKLNGLPATECEFKPWLKDTKDQLKNLNDIIAVLKPLETSASNLKEQLHEAMVQQITRFRLFGLPDEILLKIIGMAIDAQENRFREYKRIFRKDLLSIAAVCRRFRDVIHSSASFWTEFTNTESLCPEATSAALERSGDAKISLSVLCCEGQYTDSVEFVTRMRPHFHRLSSLLFSDMGDAQMLKDVLSIVAETQLPSLHSLDIDPYTDPDADQQTSLDTGLVENAFHIYTNAAPSLRHLGLANIVPRAHVNLKLTSIDLTLASGSPMPTSERPFEALLSFLSTQPSLESVCIMLKRFRIENDFHWGETIHLPVLRELHVRAPVRWGTDSRFATQIAHSLFAPAVEGMTFEIFIGNEDFVMEFLFPKNKEYPCLKTIFVDIQSDEYVHISPFKTFLGMQFPVLEYLSLSVLDGDVHGDLPALSSHTPPPLRTIRIERCEGVTIEVLKQVLGYLSRGLHWCEFEQLRVIECKHLSTDQLARELDGLVPKSKIYVRNY